MKNKNILILIGAGIIAVGLAIWTFSASTGQPVSPSPSIAPEPPPNPNLQTIQVKLNETKTALGAAVTPKDVLEDSRCPTNVQCIQAGTVKVSANLVDENGESAQIFELDKPITTQFLEIILVRVEPLRTAGIAISKENYLFYFQIKKL